MQCPANVCRICGEKEGVSLNEYIEAGRDAAQTARNKANKSKHAPQGPGWIATYLEKELSQCDKDTPVCSPCIEEHEIKYNRKWETTKASATPLCAAGFWSCTEKKGMQEVELGNERASLLTSHGIYCVGAHIQLCGTHLRAQQRAAKKMEQQTDAVTVTAKWQVELQELQIPTPTSAQILDQLANPLIASVAAKVVGTANTTPTAPTQAIKPQRQSRALPLAIS